MYQGIVNSPSTELTEGINAVMTAIPVADISVFPPAPSLAIIGEGDNAETILYGARSGNSLSSVTRGFEGAAQAWSEGTPIARNHANYDQSAFIDNINAVNSKTDSHITDTSNPHNVTAAEIGLGNVPNMAVASQAEAEAATSNDRLMTPLRAVQTIRAQVINNLTSTATNQPLSANQGRILDETKVNILDPAINWSNPSAAARGTFFQRVNMRNDGTPQSLDLNTVTEPGIYAISTGTNIPTPGQVPGSLHVIPYGLSGANLQPTQVFYSVNTGSTWTRRRLAAGTWTPWSQTWAGADLPLESGSWTPRVIGADNGVSINATQNVGQWLRIGPLLNVTFVWAARPATLNGAVGELRMVDLPFNITDFIGSGSCGVDGFRYPTWVTGIHGNPITGLGQNFIRFRVSGMGIPAPFNPASILLNTSNITIAPPWEAILEGSIAINMITV